VWRLLQDAAVMGSAALGWSPQRYREEGIAFVVRRETVEHRLEIPYGSDLQVRTWVNTFRGGRFSNRQVRVHANGELACRATQEWVHVKSPGMRIARASPELTAAFVLHDLDPDVTLPDGHEVLDGPEHRWSFECWHTWMDPLAHANHPLYVDWCDEALSRLLASSGSDPVGLVPVAEQVDWRMGVQSPQTVEVGVRLKGRDRSGAVICACEMRVDDVQMATATLVRTTTEGPEPLLRALS